MNVRYRAATVDHSGPAQVRAYFARSTHALRVNNLRSLPGEVEQSPTISRTTAIRLSIDNLGEVSLACNFFLFACRCVVSFHRPTPSGNILGLQRSVASRISSSVNARIGVSNCQMYESECETLPGLLFSQPGPRKKKGPAPPRNKEARRNVWKEMVHVRQRFKSNRGPRGGTRTLAYLPHFGERFIACT
jgi:hypothetical protein